MKVSFPLGLLIIWMLFFNAKCSENQIIYVAVPSFDVKNIEVQKNVPGEQYQKIRVELTFKVGNLASDIVLDSVYYDIGTGPVLEQKSKGDFKSVLTPKSGVGAGIIPFEKNEALLFFSENKKSYCTKIKGVIEKEEIYQP